ALEAMDGFQGLPHRMETVGEVAGVRYVNDSKATNPESAAFALASFERVRWIAGGQAKTDNLDAVRPWFGRIAKAYLIGASEAPFAEALAGHAACECLGDLDSALAAAHRDARPGETVLLAPAAASFDQWDSFEARGDAFRKGVRELAEGAG
ncbi:MAG: UDP-N-acetylmuramoyl-L-alanine--D-glutamate ligase, partial [Alphaproteobacteria bacterium]|nr:UDP-N-acetylmuramoyl-L-alanine--D-glutamate ligase [Alphaproteobacteria bacterium]